jgi:hypothetical protein
MRPLLPYLLGFFFLVAIVESRVTLSGHYWFAVQHEGVWVPNEQCMIGRGLGYRGRFGFFSLLVGEHSQIDQVLSCCTRCHVNAFAPYDPATELWVMEVPKELVSVFNATLSPHVLALTAPDGAVSFVTENDQLASISQFEGVATFIPVPRWTVALPDDTNNPIKAKFASSKSVSPDPNIVKLISGANFENVKSNNIHLSNYFTRLATSTEVLKAQDWLADTLKSLGLKVTTTSFRPGFSNNVIAELPGQSDPTKIVVLGAHYDSRSTAISDPNMRAPGADDNGSGSAAVLEIARAFANSGISFKHTIRFCFWSGEEQGLYGSRDYAAKAKATNENIIAALNADMIGYRKPGSPLLVALVTRLTTEWLTDAVQALTETYVPELTIGYTSACCSDQQSFIENGYPGMSFFETTGAAVSYPHYHKSTDLPQYVDYDQVGLITKAATAALASFAEPL